MAASSDAVFDDLRRGLGLRKHSRSESRKRLRDGKPVSLFFQTGWRDTAPPKTLSMWTLGPVQVLEALVGVRLWPPRPCAGSGFEGGAGVTAFAFRPLPMRLGDLLGSVRSVRVGITGINRQLPAKRVTAC